MQYARAHLAPWASQHMPELQRVLASLAFGAASKVSAYKELFSEGRWASLLEHFLRELYRLHALLPESALTVHLQVRATHTRPTHADSAAAGGWPKHGCVAGRCCGLRVLSSSAARFSTCKSLFQLTSGIRPPVAMVSVSCALGGNISMQAMAVKHSGNTARTDS